MLKMLGVQVPHATRTGQAQVCFYNGTIVETIRASHVPIHLLAINQQL